MHYFSVACIAKNEDLYIEEWVNFHRAVEQLMFLFTIMVVLFLLKIYYLNM